MTATDRAIRRWRKSSRSGQSGQCVELAFGYGVRDSKDPNGTVLTLGERGYSELIRSVKAGKYDR